MGLRRWTRWKEEENFSFTRLNAKISFQMTKQRRRFFVVFRPIFYRFCTFWCILEVESSFQRSCWSCHVDLSASIIKTPFHMSADFINDSTAKFTTIFSANPKCQANLCFDMISTPLDAWKRFFLFFFSRSKMICWCAIECRKKYFSVDVSNLSLGKIISGCEGCDYVVSCLQPCIITVPALIPKPWWIHFSHECINYNLRISIHVRRTLEKCEKFANCSRRISLI